MNLSINILVLYVKIAFLTIFNSTLYAALNESLIKKYGPRK